MRESFGQGALTIIRPDAFQRYETDYFSPPILAYWLQLSQGDLDAGSSGFDLAFSDISQNRYALQTLTATDDVLSLNARGIFGTGGGDDRIEIPRLTLFPPSELVPITVLAGAGDDALQGDSARAGTFQIPIITAYGGSGDDTMVGGTQDDRLEGDGFDSVIQNGAAGWFFPDVPSPAAGDDKVFGGPGADTLLGGGGNDLLYGGPRASGDLDLLTGGEGADLFLASYSPDQGAVGSEFWGAYAAHVAGTQSGSDTLLLIQEILRGAAFGGGFFVPGLSALASGLIPAFLNSLTATVGAESAADIQIVTDFDPTEDVLVIPFGASTLISYEVAFEASDPDGLTGYYASFTTATAGNPEQEFLRVFLDQGYLALMGIDADPSDQDAGAAIIESILGQTVTFSGNGDLSGLVAADVLDALGGPYTAPSGVSIPAGNALVYGAFAPVAKTQSGDDANTYVSGTVYSDVLSINEMIVDPLTITTGQMNDREAYLRGFAGADLLYGTDQADTLIGDDDDDSLHLFTTGLTSTGYVTETAQGGAGDDTIYVGETAATIDGGAGTDTLAFQWGVYGTPRAVEVDLTAAEPVATELDADGQASGFVYRLTGIESVTTGDLADTITGTGGTYVGNGGNDTITAGEAALGQNAPGPNTHGPDTHGRTADACRDDDDPNTRDPNTSDPGATDPAYVIEGGAGDDLLRGTSGGTIAGGPGADVMTVSGTGNLLDYSGSPAGVAVNLVTDTASGGDAQGDQISGFTHLTGSAGDDTLTAGNGARIDGGGGRDIYAADLRGSNASENTVELADFTAGDDRIDLRPVGVTAFSDLDITPETSVSLTTATGQALTFAFLPGTEPVGALTAGNFIFATAGAGRLDAKPAGDGLVGGDGRDVLRGGTGDDFAFGGGGDDHLVGGAGDDRLLGGPGDDVLAGGGGETCRDAGIDRLTGGAGDDLFILAASSLSVVTDFRPGSDRLGLSPAIDPGRVSYSGDEVLLAGRTIAVIEGVDTARLTGDDVLILA